MEKKKMMKMKTTVHEMRKEILTEIKELNGAPMPEGRSYWNGFAYPMLMGIYQLTETLEFMMNKYINYYEED